MQDETLSLRMTIAFDEAHRSDSSALQTSTDIMHDSVSAPDVLSAHKRRSVTMLPAAAAEVTATAAQVVLKKVPLSPCPAASVGAAKKSTPNKPSSGTVAIVKAATCSGGIKRSFSQSSAAAAVNAVRKPTPKGGMSGGNVVKSRTVTSFISGENLAPTNFNSFVKPGAKSTGTGPSLIKPVAKGKDSHFIISFIAFLKNSIYIILCFSFSNILLLVRIYLRIYDLCCSNSFVLLFVVVRTPAIRKLKAQWCFLSIFVM